MKKVIFMYFDKNQTVFDNEYQKAVHTVGVSVIPLEISLANITDAAERDEFTAFHGFVTDMFAMVYEKPEIISGAGVSAQDFYNPHKRHKVIFANLTADAPDGKYTKLAETYKKLYEAANNYKVNCTEYVETCDFRVFTKGFSRTFDDLARPLPDALRNDLTALHEYALKMGCKVEKSKYWGRIRYRYKSIPILDIEAKKLRVQITYKGNIHNYPCADNERLSRFLEEIARHENAEELKAYILKGHLAYCKWCSRKFKRARCGVWWDVFGNRRMLCGGSGVNSYNTKGDDYGIDKRVIKLFKQFLDIQIEAINKNM